MIGDSCLGWKQNHCKPRNRSDKSPLQSKGALYPQVAQLGFSSFLSRWRLVHLQWPIYRSDGGMYWSLVPRHQQLTEAGPHRGDSEVVWSKIRCILGRHREPSTRGEPAIGPKPNLKDGIKTKTLKQKSLSVNHASSLSYKWDCENNIFSKTLPWKTIPADYKSSFQTMK